MTEKKPATDFDSPWKEILEHYLPEFTAFFFPVAYTAIDWGLGFEFLDQELRQVVKDARFGKRYVDKLVKLYRQGGEEVWVLLHIEVQSQYEANFAKRMFTYHYRIFDRYDRQVGSLAILGDERETWRPHEFGYELWGSRIHFQFPVVKLLDLGKNWESLETSANPFAVVVMAHLKAQQTQKDRNERLRWKLALTKRLYEKGYPRQDVIHLFRFIDWVMSLPKALTAQFWQEVNQFEEDRNMTYITSIERLGFQRGKVEGKVEGKAEGKAEEAVNFVIRLLNRRIGTLSTNLTQKIQGLTVSQLEELGEALLDFTGEPDLLAWLNSPENRSN